ncbi:MAG: hypothetical protein ABIQ12_14795, partial [Opitutaceae bacterium]
VAFVVLAVVLLRGTGPQDLLEGLVLGPLRHPASFSLRFDWPPGIRAIAAGLGGAGGVAWWLRRRNVAGVDAVVAALRLAAAIALAVLLTRYPYIDPSYYALGLALPCLWLFVWPLAGEAPHRAQARTWVGLVLLGQSLHPFPVTGSQLGWGTALNLPLAAIGAWDAARWLAQRYPKPWLKSRPARLATRLALAAFLTKICLEFGREAERYRHGQWLDLPGAEAIRLPDNLAAVCRVLAHNATAHADVLFSLPGTFSYNLWSGVPTPTHANVTHWFSLLDATRQQAIIAELEAHPRAGVIWHAWHLKYLEKWNLAPKGPLFDYLTQNYEAAFSFEDTEFRVRRGRNIEPFLVAQLLTLSDAAAPTGAESSLLRLALLTPPAASIARLEISGREPIVLHAGNARVEFAPTNLHGEPTAAPRAAAWPVQPGGPAILAVYFRREQLPPIVGGATIVLRDPSGREVGLARLAP